MSRPTDNWMHFAADDLRSGEILFRESEFSMACFHAQQAAEKALKGFLVENNVSHPRTHDLVKLNKLCRDIDSEFVSLAVNVTILNQFYMPTRYPDTAPGMTSEGMPNRELTREALDHARDIVAFCSKRIDEAGHRNEEGMRERGLPGDEDAG